ncbi:MAG: hypothetical protein J2P25_03865 [Nocardiopsaceae bacterium]|nr:hypothetical protein [Nocardiopsaceae bacterium]
MRRKKPPKGGPPEGFGRLSGVPPPGWEEWSGYRPRPGDLAPAAGALDFTPHVARQQRRAWETAHIAWLNANGLTWTYEELAAWYDNPDRDRLPMPGVLEWQRRIGQQYSLLDDVAGVQPAHRATGPALDAAAAQEIQALRQAREADAERIRWLEHAITQAADDLSDSAARRAELADCIARQQEAIRDQAAHIQQQAATAEQNKTETGQLNRVIGQKDDEIRCHQADAARLNTAIADKDADAERLQADITRLETANRQLESRIRRGGRAIRELEAPAAQAPPPAEDTGVQLALRNHEQVARWQADLIRDLKADNQKLRDQVAQLQARNDRLSGPAEDGAADPARHRMGRYP